MATAKPHGAATDRDLYDQDFYAWTQAQAGRLRALAGDPRLDAENLAEEVADLGKSELNSVREHLVQALTHLLLAAWQPEAPPARGWRSEARTHQRQAYRRFSPGMRRRLDRPAIWRDAQETANDKLADHGDPPLPAEPALPFDLDDLLAARFDLDAARAALQRTLRQAMGSDRDGHGS
jgi:hypothetical protein